MRKAIKKKERRMMMVVMIFAYKNYNKRHLGSEIRRLQPMVIFVGYGDSRIFTVNFLK
jgi:hypothetical protein